ncbi:geranylgeranyl pyrophosphate synthetase [Mortierella sp. AD010]|nr:geranylgeranyl pyrophosphate synthetase [Mortierella sp. AD010]
MEAFNVWIRVPAHELSIITKVVEMLHTASLMIDDIEDDSNLRRGQPVAHKVFGVPATINCANYVYFLALAELSKVQNPSMHSIFTEELLSLHRGQGMEMLWRDSLTCPTEDDYITMVNDKTGGLLRLAVRLMQAAVGNSKEDYVPMVELIGIHYQIRDDYLNLQSSQYSTKKGLYEDLTEGKFSFPVIHSIHANPSDKTLLNILRKKPTEQEIKIDAVNLMNATDTFEYCRETLAYYEQCIKQEIRHLGGNRKLERIVSMLSIPAETKVQLDRDFIPVVA